MRAGGACAKCGQFEARYLKPAKFVRRSGGPEWKVTTSGWRIGAGTSEQPVGFRRPKGMRARTIMERNIIAFENVLRRAAAGMLDSRMVPRGYSIREIRPIPVERSPRGC
jgi:hypothetical protein